ncbi:MAG: hypothetical protein HKL81_10305 [Acidimicrobiaceae bacterium]|nr:hypothetical protein [Acidimicrobiaceae bacterium]
MGRGVAIKRTSAAADWNPEFFGEARSLHLQAGVRGAVWLILSARQFSRQLE